MTDRQLECIAAIADQKSLTGAAKQLYVSQASLSQMLNKAEQELGVQLFTRTSTSMIPTYAGDQYLAAASEIAEIKRNLTLRLKDIDHSCHGRITIGIAQKRSFLFMPVVLSSYMKQFPDVEIVFLEDDQQLLEDMLLRGKVDVAFVTHPQLKQELEYQYLYWERILLALPADHPLNAHLDEYQPVPLSLLKDIPFVLARSGHNIRQLCDQAFADADLVPNVKLESHSLDVCFQMAAYGIGATMVPDTLVKAHSFRNRVRCYQLGEQYGRKVAIAYRKNMYMTHVLKEFISIASQQIIAKYQNGTEACTAEEGDDLC